MRSALLVCDRAALLKHLRQRFAINWRGAHGAAHWARVRNNGLMIAAATGANMAVLELFAFFHDSCRVNEYTDHDHGKRGAELALKLQGRMFEASAGEMNLLVEACTGHSDGHTEADITVQTCWDADRLDLGEPAACKSLKINKVASRALAFLLITERGICGNRAGKRAVHGATRATSLRFSLGERAKKNPNR